MYSAKWNAQHLADLEAAFPEVIGETDTTKLLMSSGARAVVHFIRMQVLMQKEENQHEMVKEDL